MSTLICGPRTRLLKGETFTSSERFTVRNPSTWVLNTSGTKKRRCRREEKNKKRHSQQLRPQDHGDFFARVVAAETQAEEMAGAGLPRAEHAGRAPDGRQVEILRLAGAHPDLVPQGVVDHGVAVLAGKDGPLGESSISSIFPKDPCAWLRSLHKHHTAPN